MTLLVPDIDCDLPTKDGDTPLLIACENGSLPVIQVLVETSDANTILISLIATEMSTFSAEPPLSYLARLSGIGRVRGRPVPER